MRRAVTLLTAVLALGGCGDDDLADLERPAAASEQGRAESFAVERDRRGSRPTGLGRGAPGDPGALGAEQPGRVVRSRGPSQGRADGRATYSSGAEQGLLGIAFHSRLRRNGCSTCAGSDREGDTRVAESASATTRSAAAARSC